MTTPGHPAPPESPAGPLSAATFRQMVESANDGFWLIDREGSTLYVNRGLAAMLGYVPEEMRGKSFYDFMTPEACAQARGNLARRHDGVAENHEFDFRRRDGSLLHALVATTPLRDDAGEVYGAMAIVLDLSEQKRREEFGRSSSFVDSLIENLPLMIFVKDARTLRFVRFNKAGEALLGIPREDLIGKGDGDFFPPDQARAFQERDRAVLAGREVVDTPEERLRSRSLGDRLLHTRKIPLLDEAGQPAYLLGISEDITELKKAQEAERRLIREEAIYREREKTAARNAILADAGALLASSLDYHVSLRQLGESLVRRFCDWCTISVKLPAGKFERVVAVHRDAARAPLLERLWKINPVQAEQPDRAPRATGLGLVIETGASRLCSPMTEADLHDDSASDEHLALIQALGARASLIVPIVIRGEVSGVIALMGGQADSAFDLEDQALAEEIGRRAGIAIENATLYESARRAIQARDEFFSVASHELKTPITALKLQLQMLSRQVDLPRGKLPSGDRLARALETANAQVIRLHRLVDTLLDVSRLQAGLLELSPEVTDVSSLLADIVGHYAESFVEARCPLTLEIDPGLHSEVDAGKLEQVLVNLISNAIKYAPGHPVRVRAETAGERMEITFTDDGPGIPLEKQAAVFERFERAVSNHNISGLGLGLFIARRIVQAHGGTLDLTSRAGQGCSFRVRLPLHSLPALEGSPGLTGISPLPKASREQSS